MAMKVKRARWLGAVGLLVGCAHPVDLRPTMLLPVDPSTPVGLPADHAPHPTAQSEWWHVHADLTDVATGTPLHIFAGFVMHRTALDRVALVPVDLVVPEVQFAVVRVQSEGRSWEGDRLAFPDRFSASVSDTGLRHGDWRLEWEGDQLHLVVVVESQEVDLILRPEAPPVLPGDDGRMRLRDAHTSGWLQLEGVPTEGRWEDGRQTRFVAGTAFYKRQWGRLYDADLDGFEWVSMDLPGGGGLSLGWLSDDGMRGVHGTLGWVSAADGVVTPLPIDDTLLEVTRTWKSSRTGAEWPVAWTLSAPGIELEIEALVDDQELVGFPSPMHVGPAHATGEVFGAAIDQLAFIEQVGPKASVFRPLVNSPAPVGVMP